ncbi:MAG: nucleotidyltransferase domain-containing protein [Patescibacteria group bacterium]|nr:nucleotidyltransferase domain-containing protein [Patescibacteria group bacterium]
MHPIIDSKLEEIQKACNKYDVKTLYLFGSASKDSYTKDSDLDFLVSFKEMPLEKYSDNYFALNYQFRELFEKEIDLITDKSLSNPYFIEEINKSKKLIYES